ncbi:MAG: SH3 domain protein [Oleiphilaceae bacterium]|jgi:SH3 domain protein
MLNKISQIIILSLLSCTAWSQSMYINDTLLVPLRSGEGTSFRIVHKGLKSGMKLEILEQSKASGYSKIRTPGGIEGYLPTRYLTGTPIAKIQLVKAKENISLLQTENTNLKKELGTITKAHTSLDQNYKKTSSELASNSKELTNIKSISANALNLDRRNRELRESNEQLRSQLELLQTENMRLKDKSGSNTMLMGGGLVTLGIIIALVTPLIRPSKKSDSWA